MIYILFSTEDDVLEYIIPFGSFESLKDYIIKKLTKWLKEDPHQNMLNEEGLEHNRRMYLKDLEKWHTMTDLRRPEEDNDSTHFLTVGQIVCREVL
jgi:hypothetical protein